MFSIFTEDAQKILVSAKKESIDLKNENINTGHILLAVLSLNNELSKKLNRFNLSYKNVKEELNNISNKTNYKTFYTYSNVLKKVLEDLIIVSKENKEEITGEKILISIIKEGDGVAYRLMQYFNVDISSLLCELNVKKKKYNKKVYLEEIGINLNKKAKNNSFEPVIGRDNEISRIIEILSRKNKNNPILIGKAGVGKTAIVEELSRRIESYDVPEILLNKQIISIDLASIVSGTKYRGEFEEKFKKIINEALDDENVILFVDEIHTIVGAGSGEGAIDASNILKPYLARNNIKLIGATTLDEYKKYIEKDKALERRFQKVFVEEPDKKSLKNILLKVKSSYEKYHGVVIKDEIIDEILNLSNLYLYDRCEPDKSIDILDEVCSKVSLKVLKEEKKLNHLKIKLKRINNEKEKYIIKENFIEASKLKKEEVNLEDKIKELDSYTLKKKQKKIVTKNDVVDLISLKSNIPLIRFKSFNEIDKIGEKLKKKIINQENAIDTLIEVTKKIKLNLKNKNKSFSLLFLGESGVGKTYLAKTYSSYITDSIIKIDMNEFTTRESINKLIGSPAGYVGYNDNKNIFEEIRNKPFSVLILDEIEKAHKSVINLFLNILDEGYCKDNKGNMIRFDNALIIMTSNALLKTNKIGYKNENRNNLHSFFPKEFINRIDEIIEFNNFTYNDAKTITINEINKYKNIKFTIEEIETIIKESNYQSQGIRNLIRKIKKECDKKMICNIT